MQICISAGCSKPVRTERTEMTSYTPETYYGLIPGSYRKHGGPRFGLIPWPAHLRPREPRPGAELSNFTSKAKKGSEQEQLKILR